MCDRGLHFVLETSRNHLRVARHQGFEAVASHIGAMYEGFHISTGSSFYLLLLEAI
jgi:acetolactate synthase regulatory subunit